MSAYSEKVMDHFQHPRNMGEIENASGVGTVGNAKCGDIMRIFLDIDEQGIIRDVKFKTFGCGAAVATSSMATELVKGKSIQDALKITNAAVMEALDGLPPVKVHCSLLAEEAIHAALWDYAEKKGIKIEGLEKPKSDIHEGILSACKPKEGSAGRGPSFCALAGEEHSVTPRQALPFLEGICKGRGGIPFLRSCEGRPGRSIIKKRR